MNITPNKNEPIDAERAKTIIEYAKYETELEPLKLISLIKDLVLEKHNYNADYWKWKVLGYIEQTTRAIQLDYDSDVDIETGDWGLPVIVGNDSKPLTYEVKNKKYLIGLLEYIEDQTNDTFGKISKYFIGDNKMKWVCQNCNRYLGKELLTYEEIQSLLTRFSIGEYWKCRSCKKNNWFEIDHRGFIFFYSN